MEENVMTDEQFKRLETLFDAHVKNSDLFRGYHYNREFYFSCDVIDFIAENLEAINKIVQQA